MAILGRLKGAHLLNRIGELVQANQELTALIVAVGLALIIKGTNSGFPDSTWIQVAIQAVTAAIVTGFAHDKIVKPGEKAANKIMGKE